MIGHVSSLVLARNLFDEMPAPFLCRSAAHRPVLDRHPGDAAALFPCPPGCRGERREIGGGGGVDLGLERQADAQLLQEGRVGVGEEGGLEVLRFARTVRQDLVVDVLLRRLHLPAGNSGRLSQ